MSGGAQSQGSLAGDLGADGNIGYEKPMLKSGREQYYDGESDECGVPAGSNLGDPQYQQSCLPTSTIPE
jgi:hypothetical protein